MIDLTERFTRASGQLCCRSLLAEVEIEAADMSRSSRPLQLEQAYRYELHGERMTKMVRDALTIVVSVNSFYSVSDYFLYPEHFVEFVLIRMALNGVAAFLYFYLAFTRPVAAELTGCLATGGMMLLLTYRVGGMTSDYYTGLAILFAGMPILVPLRWDQALWIESGLIGVLCLSPLVLTEGSFGPRYIGNLCFLVAMGAVSVGACFILDELRYQDFCQRRALGLARDELRVKNADLKSAGQEIELLARAVYHDLRSPLAAASEALKVSRKSGQEMSERFLDLAEENLGRADAMAVGLRDLLRTVGKRERIENVSLGLLLSELKKELHTAHADEEFRIDLQADLGRVQAQPAKLEHVFRNLIGNALRYSGREEGLIISVGSKRHGDELMIFVSDNGQGVPYEYQPKIFDPFRRGPQCDAEGTGLGLALVKQIVEQHGGKVWLDSIPGEGARFGLTLPRVP